MARGRRRSAYGGGRPVPGHGRHDGRGGRRRRRRRGRVAPRGRRSTTAPWPRMSGRERGRILHRVAELIRENADEHRRSWRACDVGKPITLCHAVDVTNAANDYEYFAALAQTLDGATRETPHQRPRLHHAASRSASSRAITPFNFPLILAGSKIAPALAAGNTVVHKPADETPLSALLHGRAASRGRASRTAWSTSSPAAARSAGEALLRHPGVDKIAFTGSTAVGRHAAAVAGRGAQAGHHGARRQRGAHRLRGRRPGEGDRRGHQGLRLQHRPVLHGRPAPAGRAPGLRAPCSASSPTPCPACRSATRASPRPSSGRWRGSRHLREGRGVRRPGPQGGRPHRLRRRAARPGRRLLLQAHGDRRPAERLPGRPGGDLRPGPHRAALRHRGRGDRAGQLHAVRPGLGHPDRRTSPARTGSPTGSRPASSGSTTGRCSTPRCPFGGVKDSGFGREYGPEALDAYTRIKSVVVSLD